MEAQLALGSAMEDNAATQSARVICIFREGKMWRAEMISFCPDSAAKSRLGLRGRGGNRRRQVAALEIGGFLHGLQFAFKLRDLRRDVAAEK